jgi:hypothetical protein
MGIDVDYIYHPQLYIQNGMILTNKKPRSISRRFYFCVIRFHNNLCMQLLD